MPGSQLRARLAAVRGRFRTELASEPVDDAEARWFWEHYEQAPREIEEFCLPSGVVLEGQVVADLGCGDGIMALGVAHKSRPAALIAFDIAPTDRETLVERVRPYGLAEGVPETLEFRRSEPTRIPADDASFDVVYTWSVFEHVADPVAVLREIRRILKPGGALMLQLWPFYFSALGSHLWEWFPEHFHHLLRSEDALVAAMRERERRTPDLTEYMIGEFSKLNRITVDELHQAILAAGLEVRKLQMIGETVTVPPEANRYPLSHLGISGIKLLAVPSSAANELVRGGEQLDPGDPQQ